MGICDTDQARIGAQPLGEAVEVELPTILEAKLQPLDVRADRDGRLEVRCVVGRTNQRVRPRFEKRRGDDEQGSRGTRGHENILRPEIAALGCDERAQPLRTTVIAVWQHDLPDICLDAVVGETHVGERALRKVVL